MKTQQLQQKQPEQMPFTQQAIEELQELGTYEDLGFRGFADSLDAIFYEYIQNSVLHSDNILVTHMDIFNIMQIKRILMILQDNLITDNIQ